MRKNYSVLIFAAAIIILGLFAAQRFAVSWNAAPQLANNWKATEFWVESARCAKEYHIPLIGCENGKILPFADLSPADDIGHAMLLDVYAIISGSDIHVVDAGRLNTVINFAGILLVALLLLQARLFIAAALTLASVSLYAGEYLGLAPHPAQLGATLLASLLPLSIVCLPPSGVSGRRYWMWVILSTALLGLAFCIRQSIGMMGASAAAFSILLMLFRGADGASKKILRAGFLACLVVASSLVPTMLLRARDAIWDVPPPTHIEGHGIWHNVYIGLGVVPNKFGIQWRDEYAMKQLQEKHPSVPYVSNEYYNILRKMYFDIIQANPAEVLRIYTQKLGLVFQARLQRPFPPISWALPLLLALALSAASIALRARPRNPSRGPSTTAHTPALVVVAVFVVLFVAQGTIIHPDVQYLFPVGAFVLMAASVSTDSVIGSRTASRREQAITA